MQPGEALGVAAQVAVTLAGFAGIVVVFRPQSVHEWSEVDRFRLTLLLMNSALPLISSLFGMLLLTVEPVPASIWRWCSGLAFVSAFFIFAQRRRVPELALPMASKFIYYGVALMATSAMVLQVINFTVWNRFWPFFASIFVYLFAAVIQFLRMLLLPPK